MSTWYCTQEDVESAMDTAVSARNTAQIRRAIEAGSRGADTLCHRRFWPQTATRYFDWPRPDGETWRLWLDEHELVSVTTLTAGGTTIAAADYFLEPANTGPPYTRIEIDRSSSAAFAAGNTPQRAIEIAGVFAGCPVDETAAGSLAEALDASETSVDVTDSATIGVGSLIRVGAERMTVTGKTMLDSGQNTGGALAASMADTTVAVATGSAYTAGETILVDAERMLIVDIAGNNLVVRRAWRGATLAAHNTNADVYAPRTLTVVRGAVGTTAAVHDTATAVFLFDPPPLVRDYSLALAVDQLLQETSGYARTVGAGDNEREASGRGLRGLRDQVYAAHGRKVRHRAV